MLRKKKARESPKDRIPKAEPGARVPWSGAPGAARAGLGVAPAPSRGCAALCKPQRGRLPARERGIIQVFTQSAHLCIGNEGREESGWEAAAFWMQILCFFHFLKQVFSRPYKNYIYMILTFYNLLLVLRTWPVLAILKTACCIHVAWHSLELCQIWL